MSNTVQARIGDSFSYAGTVTLPAGNWSAVCTFVDNRNPRYQANPNTFVIPTTLTLVGANASDPTRNDWLISLTAPSNVTMLWPRPEPGAASSTFRAAIKFRDDASPPIVRTSETFNVRILPQVVV